MYTITQRQFNSIDESKANAALFDPTNDPELDGFTIMVMQLILQNWLILFERQASDYLAGGKFDHNEKSKDDVRNVPLTNRGCEAAMGVVYGEVKICPNVTPGYIECRLLMKGSSVLEHLS